MEIIQIPTKDGLKLPGVIYHSSSRKKVAIYLHGNGSSSVFYNHNEHKEQIKALKEIDVGNLLFNNRGAHFIKSFRVNQNGQEKKKRFGAAYEIIKDCIFDIDAAISVLENFGYQEFYLIGLSTGANKICVYNHYKPKNKVSKYILLSGGDDTGIYYHFLGPKKFKNLLTKAKDKIGNDKGQELISEILPNEIFSYQSYFDTCFPSGDYNCFPFSEVIHKIKLSTKPLFHYFNEISKPALVAYGEFDEYAWGNVSKIISILKSVNLKVDYEIVKGADHEFSAHQKELNKLIKDWLIKN